MLYLKFVSVLLAVLLSGALPTAAVPAVRTSLQKSRETSNDFEIAGEDYEPLYAYVYEYEENSDQIWSDCSKLVVLLIIHLVHPCLVLDCKHGHANSYDIISVQCTVGKDQSVMKIEDIELDPNPPQKGESVTVTVKAKLCKSCI